MISRFTEVQLKIHDSWLQITHNYTLKSTYTQNEIQNELQPHIQWKIHNETHIHDDTQMFLK